MDAVDYILAVTGSKAYADSILTAFARFKGVSTAAELPASPAQGDVYLVSDDFTIGETSYTGGSYVGWNGTAWQVLPKQAYTLVDGLTSDSASAALTAKQGKVLKTLADSKQDALSFDDAPTESSDNPVKSGGIKTYVDTAVATKSAVSVSDTGSATDEVQFITIDGVEKKLAGGTGGASITIVSTDPTSATVGTVGAMQYNSVKGIMWVCTSATDGYTWQTTRPHIVERTITETS